ncbi:hypothetical protein AB0F17_57915 [Nonomuraea sp. NPDC026600]|uniref:hypothetical protein n=1 Tax=Nonomuraea sp. NPDC026600 TaxID=3155363 RepID=UPI0033F61636
MTLTSLARATATMMVVAVAATTLTVGPAAAVTTFTWQDIQGQFDNDPANGAVAWTWIWNGRPDGRFAMIEYEYYDGTFGTLGTTVGTSSSANVPKDIWRIRAGYRIPSGWIYSHWQY